MVRLGAHPTYPFPGSHLSLVVRTSMFLLGRVHDIPTSSTVLLYSGGVFNLRFLLLIVFPVILIPQYQNFRGPLLYTLTGTSWRTVRHVSSSNLIRRPNDRSPRCHLRRSIFDDDDGDGTRPPFVFSVGILTLSVVLPVLGYILRVYEPSSGSQP